MPKCRIKTEDPARGVLNVGSTRGYNTQSEAIADVGQDSGGEDGTQAGSPREDRLRRMFAELIGKDLLQPGDGRLHGNDHLNESHKRATKGRLNRRALVKLKGCEEQSGSS